MSLIYYRFTVITQDLHSGCTNVSIQLKLENSDDIKYETEKRMEITVNIYNNLNKYLERVYMVKVSN